MKKKLFYLFSILCLFFVTDDVFADGFSCPSGSRLNVNVCKDGCMFDDLEEATYYAYEMIDDCYIDEINFTVGEGRWNTSYMPFSGLYKFNLMGAGVDKTYINVYNGAGFMGNNRVNISNLTFSGGDTAGLVLYFNGQVKVQNVNVNANGATVGIFTYGNENVYLDNVNVKNADKFGLLNYRCSMDMGVNDLVSGIDANYQVTASEGPSMGDNIVETNNCDFGDPDGCSVVDGCFDLDAFFPNECERGTPLVEFGQRYGRFPDKTTILHNTKLSCAAAIGSEYEYNTPYIYVPKDNSWTVRPNYGDNVFEEDGGIVEIEYSQDRVIKLTNKDTKLENVFEGVDIEDIDWNIDDLSIAKVENGSVIPLKVGTTTITGELDGITYTLNLKVTNDLLNPNTINSTYYILGFLVIVMIGTSFYALRKKRN